MNERYTTTQSFRNVQMAIRRLEQKRSVNDSKIKAFQNEAEAELAKEISAWRTKGLVITTLIVGTIVLLMDLDEGDSLLTFFGFAFWPGIYFILDSGGKKAVITDNHESALKARKRLNEEISRLRQSETAFYRTEAIYWRQKKGVELEEALKPVLQHQFDCALYLTTASGDGGIDLMGRTSTGKTVLVQSKGWEGKVGTPVLREFLGSCIATDPTALRILVGTGGFSAPAIEAAEQNEILLCDATDLVRFSENFLDSIEAVKQTSAGIAKNNPQTKTNKRELDVTPNWRQPTAKTKSAETKNARSSQPAVKKAVIAVCKFCFQRNRIKVDDQVSKVKIRCARCGRSFNRRLSDHDF